MFAARGANDGRAGRKRQENLGNSSEAIYFPATLFSGNREDVFVAGHSFDVNNERRVDSQERRRKAACDFSQAAFR